MSHQQLSYQYEGRFEPLEIPDDQKVELIKILHHHITCESAIKLSRNMTTNLNESLHHNISTFTEGKYLALSRSNSWECCVAMVKLYK